MSDTKVIRVVIGVIPRRGQVLMEQRSHTAPIHPSMWGMPGGKVNEGEAEVDALARELWEELRVKAKVGAQIATCRLHYLEYELIVSYYLCDIGEQAASNLTAAKVAWADLAHMVRYFPCTPSTYIVYQEVMAAIRDNL